VALAPLRQRGARAARPCARLVAPWTAGGAGLQSPRWSTRSGWRSADGWYTG